MVLDYHNLPREVNMRKHAYETQQMHQFITYWTTFSTFSYL